MWQAEQGDRLAAILGSDPEVAGRMPDQTVAAAAARAGALIDVVGSVMRGYADRPAVAERTLREDGSVTEAYAAISYRDLWDGALSISTALRNGPAPLVRPGDIVAGLAPSSIDYAMAELALVASGAVSVPLIATAPPAVWAAVLDETRPRALLIGADVVLAALGALPPESVPPVLVVVAGPGRPVDGSVVTAARERLAAAGLDTAVHTLADLREQGRGTGQALPFVPSSDDDLLSQIIYTSGTTGAPKGALFPERVMAQMWKGAAQAQMPAIVVHYMPLSHIAGRMVLVGTLARGGTCFFAGRGDMTTLLEDVALVRPTELFVIPRVCEVIHDRFRGDVEGRVDAGADRADAVAAARTAFRDRVLGGRVISAVNGSAPLGNELRTFMQSVLGVALHDGYGTTEVGGVVMLDNRLRRPPVLDFKLVDVPELGYFATDKPYPRGELLIKTTSMFPGYYNQPQLNEQIFDEDGFYRTGDVMALTGPEELHFVDRRNNVLKLSQAEFVTVSKIEDVLSRSPLVEQVFVYGRSGRAHLLAVVVPSLAARTACPDDAALRRAIMESVRAVAADAALHSYEVPQDIIVEHEPFTVAGGLLSGVGKLVRPSFNDRYENRLEALYAELADGQDRELVELRRAAPDRSVVDTVLRAAAALVGGMASVPTPDMHLTEVGGDSLSALSLSALLQDVFDVEVPVSVLVDPTTDLGGIARYIESARTSGPAGPTARTTHGDGTQLRADDLRLDAFLDPATLATAPTLPRPAAAPTTFLLTGANGFLGRFLALELLRSTDYHLVCLVRGTNDEDARRRLREAFSGSPDLEKRFDAVPAERLEVVAGDVSQRDLGLDGSRWDRLARTVEVVVHPAALVNHVLPYEQLFGPNVRGTAEVVRLAMSRQLKQVWYLSTIGVADQVAGVLGELDDIRVTNPVRSLSAQYASGYASSKWAGEVLLRQAGDHCGLSATVFRSTLILAHREYEGQLNLPDLFTRLLLSLVLTGVAPRSFYQRRSGDQPPSGYEGVPVDYMAEVVVGLGMQEPVGHRTFNVNNPAPGGPSLDDVVDWLTEQGRPMTRIDSYAEWLDRVEIALRALPDRLAPSTILPILDAFRRPAPIEPLLDASTDEFLGAVGRIAPHGEIPRVSPGLIQKYVGDLQLRGLVPSDV